MRKSIPGKPINPMTKRVMQRAVQLIGKTMTRIELRRRLFEGEDLTGVRTSVEVDKFMGDLTIRVGKDVFVMKGGVRRSEDNPWEPPKETLQ